MCSMFEPNHILVTLRSVKTKKSCVSGSKWNLDFQNLSKALSLGVSKPKKQKRLVAQGTAYPLRNRQGKHVFIKEN